MKHIYKFLIYEFLKKLFSPGKMITIVMMEHQTDRQKQQDTCKVALVKC